MKIQLIKSKGAPLINIQYDGMQYKPKNKTFKGGDYLGALDFAVSLPDQYVMACVDAVYDWAVENKRDVLRKKDWAFC